MLNVVSVEWPLCEHQLKYDEDATYERGEVEAKWRDAEGKCWFGFPERLVASRLTNSLVSLRLHFLVVDKLVCSKRSCAAWGKIQLL